MRWICLMIAAVFMNGCKAQKSQTLPVNDNDNTLLWQVSGKDLKEPSYIFGTFHMMCKEDISFSENLQKAIDRSEEIYFEMDLDDLSNTLGALLLMNMKDGITLKDLYTPEEYEKVENYFRDSLKTPLSIVHRMKPLFLQAMLYPKLMPCNNMSGIEQELIKIAKEKNKEIKGLETIAFQASVFDSIPYDVQAKELLKGIDSLKSYTEEFQNMLTIYKNQSLTGIDSLFVKGDFGLGESQEVLLDKRNINWVEQLRTIMAEKSVFVAVGAGHLPGKKGVLALLKDEGYTVTPIVNN